MCGQRGVCAALRAEGEAYLLTFLCLWVDVPLILRAIGVGSASWFWEEWAIDVLQKKRGNRDRAQSLARGR